MPIRLKRYVRVYLLLNSYTHTYTHTVRQTTSSPRDKMLTSLPHPADFIHDNQDQDIAGFREVLKCTNRSVDKTKVILDVNVSQV